MVQILDPIRDKFSQNSMSDTVRHLVMGHFGLSEGEAWAEIDKHFEIVDMIDNDKYGK